MIDDFSFHPAVAAWFARAFPAATPAQREAWPAIARGHDVLVAAATGSGKTLAAFLAVIDQLVREGLERGLADETRVVYVSPLKALSNDIHRNLDAPLAGVRERLAALGLPEVTVRAAVRTGDTPQVERAAMRRKPPHILVTTPESLYVMLGSASGRTMLSTCRSLIIDEIHALAGNKRGSHLALSMERLEALAGRRLVRVGLSATQTPIEEVARFLVGTRRDGNCTIVDSGHRRARDLALCLPDSPLQAVMSGEVWTEVYDRLAVLARQHRTTLVFVNTRRLAERVSRHLAERLGADRVAAHHGSLAKERRFLAEQRLKDGALQALVATSSLELGIDIGDVDLVCQLGSPRSINALLQRVGRAGHSVGGISKGRLFPLSRDELVECAALLAAVHRGELDRITIPRNALDVLSQQIAAEVGAGERGVDELFQLVGGAHPYRDLGRETFDACVRMLSQGFTTRRGRRSALLHLDAEHGVLRPRAGTRLTAVTSGGAIPDNADFRVLLEPAETVVGTVNEDFAVESLQGDVFQLGNASYRILRVERGVVRVEDAHGLPPSIPFWLGEAPGRTDELSRAVSRLRTDFDDRFPAPRADGLDAAASAQLYEYLAAGRAALGELPTQRVVVFERFFDESGGMQLVIHSCFGSRVNRAWGLALRKRFCRTFNVELQAAATEDHIILSLTEAHSFDLAEVARYVHSKTARDVLLQAVCTAPMFAVRWRWAAGIALALPRFRGGKRTAPQILRMNAEDLLAAVFPDQVACAENLSGEIEIPDHPLVEQTLRDCLQEAMDLEGLEALLRGIEAQDVRIVARDLTEPSPWALEALAARPYAYLDDAPLEERRAQAVMSRRWMDVQSAADIGRLDEDAIRRVRAEAWPDAASCDELHDALSWLTYLTDEEVAAQAHWSRFAQELAATGRAAVVPTAAGGRLWVPATRRGLFEPSIPSSHDALVEIVRGRLQALGPVTVSALAQSLGSSEGSLAIAVAALEREGFVLKGRFTANAQEEEWCERGLLARIHRYTVKRLRAEIEPVSTRDFMRFLFEWQRAVPAARMQGPDAVAAVLMQLEGFEVAAAAWEAEVLPARLPTYQPEWLDEHCRAGRFAWVRLAAPGSDAARGLEPSRGGSNSLRSTPITFLSRRNAAHWTALAAAPRPEASSSRARDVFDHLTVHGASFFDDIADSVRMLPAEVEEALGELVRTGLAHADGFAGLRALLTRHRRRAGLFGMADAGRWATVRRPPPAAGSAGHRFEDDTVECVVRALLRRWGVLFWTLLAREAQWLPTWREILACCRRLEARGELRGGRFVAGQSGEQFALPEAVALLRRMRGEPPAHQWVRVSGADPLNLVGILTPGARMPSILANRCVYLDGVPIATLIAGQIVTLDTVSDSLRVEARETLLRARSRASLPV